MFHWHSYKNNKNLIQYCRYFLLLFNQVVKINLGEKEFEEIMVELSKSPGNGLGLSVVGRRDGCGVFISDMVSIILDIDH